MVVLRATGGHDCAGVFVPDCLFAGLEVRGFCFVFWFGLVLCFFFGFVCLFLFVCLRT